MRRGHVPSVDRVHALARALGLEFYVGPPRDAQSDTGVDADPTSPRPLTTFAAAEELPVREWGSCSPEGFLAPEEWPDGGTSRAPAPVDLVDSQAFYAREPGHSMVPAGLEAGNYCLISPCARFSAGQRVWLRDRGGLEAIRWLIEITSTDYELRAWWPPDPNTGRQEMLADNWARTDVVDRGVVLAVYRVRPDVGRPPHRAPDWQPDRLALQWESELRNAKAVRPPPRQPAGLEFLGPMNPNWKEAPGDPGVKGGGVEALERIRDAMNGLIQATRAAAGQDDEPPTP